MQWYDFVFSEKRSKRLLRHSVFWIAWWIYFIVCQYLYQQPPPGASRPYYYVLLGSFVVIKTFLLVWIYIIAYYAFIYFLLPQFLNSKLLKAISGMFFLCGFLFTMAYFMFWQIFPFVDSLFGIHKPAIFSTRFWPAVSLGLIDPLKVVAAASIIKYIKYWWLKQKESERLEREKINTELELLKAQIHPSFLFTSLNNLYTFSQTASPRAPQMLLKLSELLSYMLYECNQSLVPLEKEITMMKDYMALEKIRLGDSIETELSVRGDMNGKTIAPFLLLPFIENSFKQSSYVSGHAWVNMDISIEDHFFSMKLANGILHHNSLPSFSEDDLVNVKKRLSLIYPHKHELKITREREMMFVLLKVDLSENPTEIIDQRTHNQIYAVP